MSLARQIEGGWRGVLLVAATSLYFLIFAQFAFLARLGRLGFGGSLNAMMGAMATGGILVSLLIPRLRLVPRPEVRLRLGFVLRAATAEARRPCCLSREPARARR